MASRHLALSKGDTKFGEIKMNIHSPVMNATPDKDEAQAALILLLLVMLAVTAVAAVGTAAPRSAAASRAARAHRA